MVSEENKNIITAMAILRHNGLSLEQVGKGYQLTKGEVWYRLKRYRPDSLHPDGNLLPTMQAAKIIGIDDKRFKRIAKELGIIPVVSSPRRKLWDRDSINLIAQYVKLSESDKKLCRKCKNELPEGHKGSICKECKREENRRYQSDYYTKHFRKNPVSCILCDANLVGTRCKEYCKACRPWRRKKEVLYA